MNLSRLCRAAVCLAAVCGLTSIVGGQCEYEVEVIEGPACGSGTATITGKAINDAGIVALEIECFATDDCAVWDGGPSYTLLPRPPGMASATPMDMSNVGGPGGTGTLVSEGDYGVAGGYCGFMHNSKGFINLGVIPGATVSMAEEVNDAGTVVWASGIRKHDA